MRAYGREIVPVWWSSCGTYLFAEVLDGRGEIADWWCLASADPEIA